MTPLYWTPLLAAIWNLFVAAFVFFSNPRKTANRVFLLLGTAIAVWNFGTFKMFLVETEEQAIFWARALHFGVLFLPVCLIHLSILIADLRAKWIPPVMYLLTITIGCSNFTSFYMKDVIKLEYAYYSQAGPFFWAFTPVFITTVIASIFVLIYKRKRTDLSVLQIRKLDFLIVGQSVFVLFGINDVLPILGIYHYPFTQISVYPWGTLAAVFYGTVIAYSLLQHQLLDVHIKLGRISAHIVRMVFLFIALLLFFALASYVFPEQMTQEAIAISISILFISILLVSIIFPRLLGASSEKLERTILGDQFEYHDKIRAFNHSIQLYTDGEKLLDDMQSLLVDAIGIEKLVIFFKDDNSSIYSPSHIFPPDVKPETSPLHDGSPVIRMLEKTTEGYLPLGPEYQTALGNILPNRDTSGMRFLKNFSPEFCFPFQTAGTLFGFLLIGKKTGGTPYTAQDITLLSEMTRNASLMINQIRMKRQIEAREQIELVGVMSKGLAHDLNNLFTPINTYFQIMETLAEESPRPPVANQNLLGIAQKNTQAIQTYLREALFFGDTLAPRFSNTTLAAIIDESVRLCQHRIDQKDIKVIKRYGSDLPIQADSVLLQRIFSNLIVNAIDASNTGSRLEIAADHLNTNESKRIWYRAAIIDYGEGIPWNIRKKVFTPYFTTKDSGENERGAGLGLSICKKIVHLHGGSIQIRSVEGQGSVVEVDLPSSRE